MFNRYRIDESGKYIFHTFNNSTFNKDVWLENKGNFELKTKVLVDELGTETVVTDGYYTYYLPDMVDGKYVPDMVKERKAEKQTALSNANTEYEQQVQELTAGVPESEKLTWTKQEQEARAWLLDSTVATPLIDGIVTNRGVSKDYLVGKIVEKADAYAVAVGQLTGSRQAIEDSVTAL